MPSIRRVPSAVSVVKPSAHVQAAQARDPQAAVDGPIASGSRVEFPFHEASIQHRPHEVQHRGVLRVLKAWMHKGFVRHDNLLKQLPDAIVGGAHGTSATIAADPMRGQRLYWLSTYETGG